MSFSATNDIHDTHPADCRACAAFPANRACLSHTCPDCGFITHALLNDRNELIHDCPSHDDATYLGAVRRALDVPTLDALPLFPTDVALVIRDAYTDDAPPHVAALALRERCNPNLG